MLMRHQTLPLTFVAAILLPALARSETPSLEEARARGASNSVYSRRGDVTQFQISPEPDLAAFRTQIKPLLKSACVDCHGPDLQEGNLRVDTLDPDLVDGTDSGWWLEVYNAVSNGEMPPADESELADEGRTRIIEWLSTELQRASQIARSAHGHSSFRRMTRYEYNYALQDLLGLPYNFVEDLPPETPSEDGFQNSSEMLQMSVSQFETYREIARKALAKATVDGDQPEPVYYAVTMDFGLAKARKRFESDLQRIRKDYADDPEALQREITKRKSRVPNGAHYRNLETGFAATAQWGYSGARFARTPASEKPETPALLPDVAIIPSGQRLIVDLGDHLPATGPMLVRVRAGRLSEESSPPTLRLYFGHQASNNSRADERVGDHDITITAKVTSPEFYEFEIPLSEVVRNPFRGIQKLGQTPNPAEYLMLRNTSDERSNIQIDYIEIAAPSYESWPPDSHRKVFADIGFGNDEIASAREVLSSFMTRAWRRPPTDAELNQKTELFAELRPHCDDPQEAMLEVLADVLSSPKFLYLVSTDKNSDDYQLATRLAMFLWSSLPDEELLELARAERLSDPEVLNQQIERLLTDPRGRRFSNHFVRQWLGMQLLDHAQIDEELRAAMRREPIELFDEILRENSSVIDFLHADYTMANAKLAKHYRLKDVQGQDFRRVSLSSGDHRGGLLTQAGLLAMNSDGKDSHPLKRGIWLLEKLLNDPPPPPPPAVPEIDLTDPEILKLTLKERMEDHRNDPACMSCHQRIDPWGIAFENYDAAGQWRTSISGKPVDATSTLFNREKLDGMDGLKRYLLANRQDQFARAMAQKLTAYALGRPLGFADRAEIDRITGTLRQQGDGLRTLIHLIVTSDLFRS